MVDYKKQGRRNRQRGANWEKKVRAYLESQGWFVSKFQNNIECIKYTQKRGKDPDDWGECKMCSAKAGFFRLQSTGFPDFICWGIVAAGDICQAYNVWGVECKSKGLLDKIERAKCRWFLEKGIFTKILIAKKKKEGRKVIIELINFNDKYL